MRGPFSAKRNSPRCDCEQIQKRRREIGSDVHHRQGAKAASSAVEQLPNLDYPESAARVLGKLARYAEWRVSAGGHDPRL